MDDLTKKQILASLTCFGRFWKVSDPVFAAGILFETDDVLVAPDLMSYTSSLDIIRAYYIIETTDTMLELKHSANLGELSYVVGPMELLETYSFLRFGIDFGFIGWEKREEYTLLNMLSRPRAGKPVDENRRPWIIDRILDPEMTPRFDGVDLIHIVPSPIMYS